MTLMDTYVLCAPVDEGGPLEVRLQQVVDRVLLRQAAVHGDHGALQNNVGVAQV